mmetsp:Transcript_89120/g.191227  ORF Transcript_89120/g.191227 Transcript_89120/m.191227 type:complete len:88 (+) Transcript_89120:83-346(+)
MATGNADTSESRLLWVIELLLLVISIIQLAMAVLKPAKEREEVALTGWKDGRRVCWKRLGRVLDFLSPMAGAAIAVWSLWCGREKHA